MLTTLLISGRVDSYLDVWDRMEDQSERKLPTLIQNYVFRVVECVINRAIYSRVEDHINNQLEEDAGAH